MEAKLNQNLTIELNTQGRNTIPYIDYGNIITIHGKNGVGKSMAATLLEIASGNYIFESESRFKKLAEVIESCEIQFKIEDNLLYKTILKPHLWSFNKNLNGVNPLTLGKFYKVDKKKEKEIDFEEFRKDIYIRTIRGNESLEQQIFFFKDIFTAKIGQKLKQLDDKIDYLEKYQNLINIDELEKISDEYTQLQQKYNDELNKINNFENSIRNREANIKNLEGKLKILQQLIKSTGNDVEILKKNKKVEEEKLSKIKTELEKKYKELSDIKQKKEELTTRFDKKTKETFKNLNKLRSTKENLEEQLISKYKLHLDKKNSVKSDQYIKEIKDNIGNYQNKIKSYKVEIEKLNKNNERIIEINKYLTKLRDICSKASFHDFGKDKLIKATINKKSYISFSFEELYKIFHENNIEFKQDKELKEYQNKVESYNKEINENRKKLNVLKEYNKILEKITQMEADLKGKGSTIDSFIDINTQFESLDKKRVNHETIIENLDKEILEINQKVQDLNTFIKELESMPTQTSLLKELEKMGIKIDRNGLMENVCKQQCLEIQKEVNNSQVELKAMIDDQNVTKQRLGITRKALDNATKDIKKYVKNFGYTQIGEFLDYLKPHIEKFHQYIENTKKLYNRLKILKDDIERVINGIKPKNETHLKIINIEFDNIFKRLYEKNEFFEYVFKNYSKIKKFDIVNRTIIFKTLEGLEESRDLEEFSSGEKTYAYCRSIISMTANMARYNIIILDESYALLDREHSKNLYQFQKQMVQEKGITKFINILPLKENLDDLINSVEKNLKKEEKYPDSGNLTPLKHQLNLLKCFQKEVSSRGYYQEINYPDELRKEINVSSDIIKKFNSQMLPIVSSEKELPFSFILDGSNIARHNTSLKKANIRDVLKCKKKLETLGVPENCIFIVFGAALRHYIPERDKNLYESLLTLDTVNQAPAERDDDWFIIKYAIDHNSYIITNDIYREYREKSSSYEEFIKTHSIRYSIIGNDIIFEEGFKEKIKSIMSSVNNNK